MNITSYQSLESALHLYAETEAKIAKAEAEMNAEIETVREKHNAAISDTRKHRDDLYADIEGFAIDNKKDFEKVRSKEFPNATVGFSINPPKVNLLNRKLNNKTVLELIKRIFKGKFIRVKEDLDKESILAAYANKEVKDDKLAAVGLRIDQDESFYVKVKWDSLQ